MIHMMLYWGKNVTLLIDSWKTDSWTSYVLSLLACLVVASFYQYMKNRQIQLKLVSSGERRTSLVPEIRIPLLRLNKVSTNEVAKVVLFGLNSAMGYLLMLAIMSFNGGVFVTIVVGLTFGYFFFRSQGGEDGALIVAMGYLLMLATMSFNGGVFVTIVVGRTFGYFFFRSQGEEDGALIVDNNSCGYA